MMARNRKDLIKTSDYIARFIEAQGVTTIFELVGGMITHLLDSFHTRTHIKIISMHHEQAAGFAAEGFGRVTGLPGIALATSGPGATNLLTAVGSCYFDSVPAIFITGQVNRNEMKGDRAVRQLGFQETDIVSMSKPITKWAVTIQQPDEVETILTRAFQVATNGRPGPVLIDIPMDIQRLEMLFPEPAKIGPHPLQIIPCLIVDPLIKAMATAERPLILAGGGIRSSGTAGLFREFVQKTGIPVAHSLMGVDLLPFDQPERVGMIGSYGNRWANTALARSDLLVVMGSRLDIRQTGTRTDLFKAGRDIFHIDCDASEINNRVQGCHFEVLNLHDFFSQILTRIQPDTKNSNLKAWRNEIQSLKSRWPDTAELAGCTGINPNKLMHQISKWAYKSSAIVVDVGQHQMWAAQSMELQADQRFLTSGGMGAMGFALPAAIGAYFSNPGPSVTMIAGDGGFQLNLQELQTVARNRIPLKMIILDNQCHGMVRQFQESYFDSRYQSTKWGYSAPDFTQLATAYAIPCARVEAPELLANALSATYAEPAQPYLLHVVISPEINTYPKMAFGRPMHDMEPDCNPLDMEGT